MSEVSLNRLRDLRERASTLQRNILSDLKPFVKGDGTFRRKPDSPDLPKDVNVTTTCSSLMALALTKKFADFYNLSKTAAETKASTLLKVLAEAPWMSSGLSANNAFTTTLVLRTMGFLVEQGPLTTARNKADSAVNAKIKRWQPQLRFKDAYAFAEQLVTGESPAADFFWLAFSDKNRAFVERMLQTPADQRNKDDERLLSAALGIEIQKTLQSGWIYSESRFDQASADTKKALSEKPTGYRLVETNHQLLMDQFSGDFETAQLASLVDIAILMGDSTSNFSINEYPVTAAVVYWFIDAIHRAKIELPSSNWKELCEWAAKQFNHERSLVVAKHDAMMDPVAMGMCSCLCSRLRRISEKAEYGATKHHLSMLPSMVELEQSVRELLSHQTDSGIFPKYFPLFHYQDAGSNFCFTFELLEAVLCEFGSCDRNLGGALDFIDSLEKAVAWCEANQLTYPGSTDPCVGWNSGGDLSSLHKEQPESWATAVVHMFLWELRDVLSQRIQKQILQKYKARSAATRLTTTAVPALDKLLDVDVLLEKKPRSILSVLRGRIITKNAGKSQDTVRHNKIKGARSALMFGPPGTSKTETARAVADELGWPMVELTPSEFVRGTLANIYDKAEEIFEDLMDLSAAVVFFDEMDALVQTREGEEHLDIASQFLTTTMLPKLSRLHGQASVVFFMATNFQDRFDAAIKRSGRFDLLLCMGPPKLTEKFDSLHKVFKLKEKTPQTKKATAVLKDYLKAQNNLLQQFSLYTFGEYLAFLKKIVGDEQAEEVIGTRLKSMGKAEFLKKLKDNNENITLKLADLEPLKKLKVKWKTLDDLDTVPFSLKQLEAKKLQPTPIIRYYCDRKESKEQ